MNDFITCFNLLSGNQPFPWQEALYKRFVSENDNNIPAVASLSTGLGKTSVIAIWLIALANRPDRIPRRLVYVVNRRTVVDQTTDEVEKLRRNLEEKEGLSSLRQQLGKLAISTLRGQFADNQEWSADPSRPAVICGTVDMIGSRLLFSGYRIGYRSRPLHAAFLGQDVLLVHDEAHLEPAFQELIETIEKEQHQGRHLAYTLPWPKISVMALSATTRNEAKKTDSLLTEAERNVPDIIPDPPSKPIHYIWRRLKAKKKIYLHKIKEDKAAADTIVKYAMQYRNSNRAILIFARKVEDVEKIVKKLPKNATEQLTGTLRGWERDMLVKTPIFRRFFHKSNRAVDEEPAKGTVYLVCTSAGEVGMNISADHLICDLSTFDSMIQRFGRVNRFGDQADTCIHVVHPTSFSKKDKFRDFDQRRKRTLELLLQLNGDASPAAIDNLDSKEHLNAFAPAPATLPATDILFDAWSLTSIRNKMPGRPPVEPFLHGISEFEPPQTQIAWREEVGIITENLLDSYKPADLLEDYPLKPHELLRDRSDRILNQLQALAADKMTAPVWLIEADGTVTHTTLGKIADPAADKEAQKALKQALANRTILLPQYIGGLRDGMLDGDAKPIADLAYDVADYWLDNDNTQRRIRLWDNTLPPKGMVLVRTIDIHLHADGSDADEDEASQKSEDSESRASLRRFWYWYARPHCAEDGSHASCAPITWNHHTHDVVMRAKSITNALGLPDELKQAVILAAELHDLGKKRELWQRSIDNPNPTDWYAKPGKPSDGSQWQPRQLSDYRHEFGSLLDALDHEQEYFRKLALLTDEMKDLVLHMIAAHHGRSRPHFPMEEIYDPIPGRDSCARQQAIEIPRRFARLQRKYGRWGLAYIESLLRAADWAASAEPSSTKERYL